MTQQEFQQRYTIVERLGEGGFGEVFKVYDTVRNRWVAMKVSKVKPELESVRLRNEVEMVNRLPEHPNIAFYEACYTFHDIMLGEYDYGILQYYEEGNLLQLLNKTLTDAQTLSGLIQKTAILTQILNGLGFLHENGIIHRDLKPQNILMVRSLNGEYVPKITDFGISKKFDVSQSSFYSNSLGGAGTLAYSSPEQLAGRKISKNADLWSFGVIAFRVLTGQLPFDTGGHASTSEAGRQELFRQINSGHLPDSVNQIPKPWQTLIRRCLITDPVQRIKNVQMAKAVLADTHGRDGARPVSTKTTDDPTKIDRPLSPKPLTPPNPDRVSNPVRINTEPPPPPSPVLKYILIAACTTVIVCLTVFFWQQLHPGSKGNNNTELTVVPSDTVSIIQDSTVQEPPKQETTSAERTSGNGTTVQNQPVNAPDYLKLAGDCFDRGDYECAKNNYTLFQTNNGRNMNAQIQKADECIRALIIADEYFNTKDYEKARDRYKIVLDQNPKDPNAKRKYDLCVTELARSTVSRFANYSETTNNLNIQMIAVQGGTFTMGCTSEQGNDCDGDEKPAHRVTVSDFYIGKYEVTQAQWRAVMGTTVRQQRDKANPEWSTYGEGDNYPMYYVSWNEVQDFIRRLNASTGKQYRLPTEAEWEFAARGGNSSRSNKYSGSSTVGNVAWYDENSGSTTHPVGTKSANELGIYDMSGNVWEWCNDWYGSYSSNAQTNPQGASSGSYRVFRGGRWDNYARFARVSIRYNNSPDYRNFSIGFRLACSSK